jgi:hypothetical protein
MESDGVGVAADLAEAVLGLTDRDMMSPDMALGAVPYTWNVGVITVIFVYLGQ